jgi:voltage-gated potassium channel
MRSVRVTRILGGLLLTRRAESTFLAASLIGLLLVLASSVAILQVENAQESNIRTASDALWWALTTITTVGYGDRYPITSEGRFVAALLMFAGVGLFGLFSGLLAAWFVAPSSEQEHNELEALRVELREIRTLLEKRK